MKKTKFFRFHQIRPIFLRIFTILYGYYFYSIHGEAELFLRINTLLHKSNESLQEKLHKFHFYIDIYR